MGAEFIVTLIVALFILLIAMCIGTAFTTPFHGAVIRSVHTLHMFEGLFTHSNVVVDS
jgi:hypothetical protein